MKLTAVILKETIRKLGSLGDVVRVSKGFARNYLVPYKKAVIATKINLDALKNQDEFIKKQHRDQLQNAVKLKEDLEQIDVLPIFSKVSKEGKLFGSVSGKEIVGTLLEKGIEIAAKNIILSGHIKAAGEHDVTVFLHHDISHTLKIHILDSSMRVNVTT